jgi:hypothetical protein
MIRTGEIGLAAQVVAGKRLNETTTPGQSDGSLNPE